MYLKGSNAQRKSELFYNIRIAKISRFDHKRVGSSILLLVFKTDLNLDPGICKGFWNRTPWIPGSDYIKEKLVIISLKNHCYMLKSCQSAKF